MGCIPWIYDGTLFMNKEKLTVTEKILELYDSYPKYCKRVQFKAGGYANAEDVVQEAFCNALRYSASYDEGLPIENWFSTILNNALRDFMKKERMEGMSDSPAEEEGTDTLDNTHFKSELVEKLMQEVQEYEEPARKALTAAIGYGWKPSEIATFSPLSANHIRVILHRFKESMRQRYGQEVCS